MRWLVLFATGCFSPTFPMNLECSPSGACPPGQLCEPLQHICVESLPGAPVPDGGSLPLVDGDTGFDADPALVDASLPCDAGGPCELVPANGALRTDLDGVGAELHVLATGNYLFDTTDGEVRNGATVIRPAGTGVLAGISFQIRGGIGIFGLVSLTIDDGGDLDVTGAHPILLLVAGDVTLAGNLDVSGSGSGTAGPGGGAGGSSSTTNEGGGCGGGESQASRFGGGGGGYLTDGGRGGSGVSNEGLACAGVTETLVPLTGGSGGARPSGSGTGGGGGGALQITSYSAIHLVGGVVHSAGGGGSRGTGVLDPYGRGGSGGGSGGAILLEAPIVTVDGPSRLTAPGGGGGGGAGYLDDMGGTCNGNDGTTPSSGGVGAGGNGCGGGGRGGAGSSSGSLPENGTNGVMLFPDLTGGNGGGGGSAGRIRVNAFSYTVTGNPIILPPATQGTPAQR